MTSRVVLYRRVSALMGRGGEDFHSPELQTEAMRRHIASLDAKIVGEFEDIDVSGRTFHREGLDKVRLMVKASAVDTVAVYDLSRLGRNVTESLAFIQFLRDHRVGLISTRERIDDSPQGQFMLTQFLALAQLQSDQIGQAWKDVHRRVAEQGRHHGQVPLGYRRGPDGLEPDPDLAPAVVDTFRRYADGKPVGQLADELGAARGKPVRRQTVKRMLANPIYIGKVALWGEASKARRWAVEPDLLVDGKHPALIDAETFAACVSRCAADSTTPPRSLAPSHALARAVVCGNCDQSAAAYTAAGGRRYRCRRRSDCGKCDGCGTILISEVEAVLLSEIGTYLERLRGPLGAERAKVIRQRRPVDDPKELTAQIEDVRAEMTRLTAGWAKQLIPDHSYRDLLADCERREGALEARRLAALAHQPREVDAGRLVAIGERLLALWPRMEPWERNEGVRLLGIRVTLWPRSLVRVTVEERVHVDFT